MKYGGKNRVSVRNVKCSLEVRDRKSHKPYGFLRTVPLWYGWQCSSMPTLERIPVLMSSLSSSQDDGRGNGVRHWGKE